MRIGKILVGVISVIVVSLGCVMPISGQDLYVSIPMHLKKAKTYYVTGRIAGGEPREFMVDTGSSYTTINEGTLDQLRGAGKPLYLRDLVAVLANGEEMVVPIYRVSDFEVGGVCVLNDIEVAVFPSQTRQLLGLSTLRKASPFQFSTEPPELRLSNCEITVSGDSAATRHPS